MEKVVDIQYNKLAYRRFGAYYIHGQGGKMTRTIQESGGSNPTAGHAQ